jgi:uncharacterized membrane protein YeaQ/YmgE (transglycosylase-associated protein family)
VDLLSLLLFGLVVGVVTRLLVPGDPPGGWIATLLIGVLGAFVGGYLGRVFGLYDEGQVAGFVMSVVGAVLLLVVFRVLAGRRSLV